MLAPTRTSNEAISPANAAPPLVQINDIRYHIFEVCTTFITWDLPTTDVDNVSTTFHKLVYFYYYFSVCLLSVHVTASNEIPLLGGLHGAGYTRDGCFGGPGCSVLFPTPTPAEAL